MRFDAAIPLQPMMEAVVIVSNLRQARDGENLSLPGGSSGRSLPDILGTAGPLKGNG